MTAAIPKPLHGSRPVSPDGRASSVPPAGEHGDDAVVVARTLGVSPAEILDLAATVNPVAPDPVPIVERHVEEVRWYPDEDAAAGELADRLEVERGRLVLTNGGAEAIALVAFAHPVGRVDEPDFALYRRHLTRVERDAPRWASNPNNPTGRLAAPAERAFVWDEAHYGLATGSWTRGDADAFVVGSLTKLFACPGLRIGYLVAPDTDAAARLRHTRPEWSVNSLACRVLPELLGRADLAVWRDRIAVLRDDLIALLTRHGLEVLPSDAPWVLASGVRDLRTRLARELVLVRDCSSFGLAGHVRIAVPDEQGLARLEAALTRVS